MESNSGPSAGSTRGTYGTDRTNPSTDPAGSSQTGSTNPSTESASGSSRTGSTNLSTGLASGYSQTGSTNPFPAQPQFYIEKILASFKTFSECLRCLICDISELIHLSKKEPGHDAQIKIKKKELIFAIKYLNEKQPAEFTNPLTEVFFLYDLIIRQG